MRTSSNPSCLTTRDLTYSRTKTNIAARTPKVMVVVANAGPLLRSPPAGGLPSEAIIGFFGKAKECATRQLIQAGGLSDTMDLESGNEENKKQAISKAKRRYPVSAQRLRAEWLCRNATQRHGLQDVRQPQRRQRSTACIEISIDRHLHTAVARLFR